jgi:hypothetical protein
MYLLRSNSKFQSPYCRTTLVSKDYLQNLQGTNEEVNLNIAVDEKIRKQ